MHSHSRVQLDEILPQVYGELREIASRALDRERTDHSYQTTELVHEAYVRLAAVNQIQWQDTDHLLRASIGVIRRVLIDYARAKKARKRNPEGVLLRTSADEVPDASSDRGLDLIELEEALEQLGAFDARKAEIVELRYFGGQEIEEIARIMGLSASTVKREWALAKAWLMRQLSK